MSVAGGADEPCQCIGRPAALRCLLAAIALACTLAGCSTPAPTTYDLTAPADVRPAHGRGAQLAIGAPVAVQVLDSDRILVRGKNEQVSYLPGAQWADRVPGLIQARLIQTFENAKRISSVGRPDDKFVADTNLIMEVRRFEIDVSEAPEAVVALTVKLVSAQTGRILAARLFEAREAAAGVKGQQASAALDAALATVLRDIVAWTSTRV
jgi:cholesterol transport system auxiliary component